MSGQAAPDIVVRARDAGLTLFELVAVLAIFALVAVAGLQAVSGAVRARERIGAADAGTVELMRAMTLLRADLKALVDMPFQPPGAGTAPEPAFLAEPREGRVALTLAGQAVLPGTQGAGLVRVVWRLDRAGGRLTRQVWPVLRPASVRAAGPEVTVLEPVRALGLRVRPAAGRGAGAWQVPGPAAAPGLPRLVEVTIETEHHGVLRVVAGP